MFLYSTVSTLKPEDVNRHLSFTLTRKPVCQDEPLNLPTNGRDCCHDFAQLQLVQNCGFTSGVKTDHKYTHVPLAKEFGEELRERETHGGQLSGVR